MRAMVSIFFRKLPGEVSKLTRRELKESYANVLYYYKEIKTQDEN